MVAFGHDMADNPAGRETASVKVSCIIPTLNRSDVLLRTIEQLFAQSEAPEIIIVDQTVELDPSTKSTLVSWRDAGRIHWVHQSEPNASKARNAGAVQATGNVLLFLDDDIEVKPDLVAAHARNYLDSKVLAVSGQVLESNHVVTTKLQSDPEDPDLGWIGFPKNYARRCRTSWMASGNFSVRRNVYLEIGGMDENYKRGAFREETDFAMRFLQKGYRFEFDPAASLVHLGAAVVRRGGARSWSSVFGWHHYIGAWYFTFGYGNRTNVWLLIWLSFRHLVAHRGYSRRFWVIPVCAACWLLAIPFALSLRMRGEKLLTTRQAERVGSSASDPRD